MKTECTPKKLQFQPHVSRKVEATFDGGQITSDGGALLLRQVEERCNILKRLAKCFKDFRKQELIEHSVYELLAQRIFGLVLGYEDLNDHETLRTDPLLALLAGKEDLTGNNRTREKDKGKPLAGKSTLNRLELTPPNADEHARYKKILADEGAIEALLLDLFIETFSEAPAEIVLDIDATDDPLHGKQEGAYFHGYYNEYCYLPLYIFCGDFPLRAILRPSCIDVAKHVEDYIEEIVLRLRRQWPNVKIIVRGDSGFCREDLFAWCERNKVNYVIGLAKNSRLLEIMKEEMVQAERQYKETKEASRVFKEFMYQTLDSWSRPRRVIGKAEHLAKGANPRFVVTSLGADKWRAKELYEDLYCARGEMENRIKEQQLDLFADRLSTHWFRPNQLRLYFSTIGYIFLMELRCLGLRGTELERAYVGTIRLKLLKIGGQIRMSIRRIHVRLGSGYPFAELFELCFHRLTKALPQGV